MPKSSDKLSNDRAEGRCARVSVNPSAIILSDNFSPLSNPPKPFDIADLRVHAKARGFIDGDTEQADFLLQRISYQHASEYFHLFEDSDGVSFSDTKKRLLDARYQPIGKTNAMYRGYGI